MYIFQILLVYLLYLVIFIFSYFALEKFFLWERIIKWKKSKIIEDFIFGFIMGIITLTVQLINGYINSQFQIPLFVSTIILIAIFKDYRESLFSLFPSFIFYSFNNYQGNGIYVTISFSLMALIFIFYLKTFSSLKTLSINYTILLLIYFLMTTLIGLYNLYEQNFKTTFINVSGIYLLSLLGYYLINYIIKLIVSSKLLYESSRYSFLRFFRPSIATSSINEFLIKNKVKYGFLVLFHLNYDKDYAKLIETNTNVNIENSFYELLQDSISKNGILFSYEGNENGFFVPAQKKGKEMISKEFSRAVKILNKKYTWGDNEIPLKITTNFGISKYGIDSQSINQLINYSSFALNDQPKKKQQIIYFDWKIYHSFLKDNKNINDLDSTFQLDDLGILFTPLYDLNNHCHFATYSNVHNISDFQTYETTREIAYIKNFQNTLDRYFASSVLLSAKGNQVIINYSPTIFENDFFMDRFLDFFTRNNIKFTSIYIIFDKMGLDKSKNLILIKKQVKEIQNLGIKIIIPNDYNRFKMRRIIDNVEFTYIYANQIKTFKNNYKKVQVICYDISSIKQILLAYKNNIRILGGSIFDQELNFIKFSKPSKIYLENIIKGANHE